jgi:hypothetical protein
MQEQAEAAKAQAEAVAQAEAATAAQKQQQAQQQQQVTKSPTSGKRVVQRVVKVKRVPPGGQPTGKPKNDTMDEEKRKQLEAEILAIERQLELARLQKKLEELEAQGPPSQSAPEIGTAATTTTTTTTVTTTTATTGAASSEAPPQAVSTQATSSSSSSPSATTKDASPQKQGTTITEKKTKKVLVKKQRDSEGEFITYRGKTYYTDSVDTSKLKWQKPEWTKEKKLRSTGKADLLKQNGGNLAKPITHPLGKGDGVNKYVRPEDILQSTNGAGQEKQIGWEKPEWAMKKVLRATGKAEILQRDGNLEKPITNPVGKGDGINKYVRPEEILSNAVVKEDKQIGWEKPDWTKKAVLKPTKKGDLLKSGGEIARPITFITDNKPSSLT